jgi:gas vesicle protein
MTNLSDKSASALERDAEETRMRLASTLDELRLAVSYNMSGEGLADQLTHYVRESGGADFMRNLGQQVRDNPLPVTLVGAGLAWLAIAGRTERNGRASHAWDGRGTWDGASEAYSKASHAAHGAGARARDAAYGAGERVGEAAHGAGETLRDAAHRAYDTAAAAGNAISSTAERIGEGLSEAGEKAARAANRFRRGASEYGSWMGDTMDDMSERAREARRSASEQGRDIGSAAGKLTQVVKENPLLIGVLGLAAGAAIAALLPTTEVEEELAEETTEHLKHAAQDFAEDADEWVGDQYAKAKETFSETAEDVKEKTDELKADAAENLSGPRPI